MSCIWMHFVSFFFFKQKTSYDMRISDWSSDVCSSDLLRKFVLRSTTELFDFALGRLSAGAMHSKLTHLRECARALGKHQYLRNLPSPLAPTQLMKEIGRASCRARVCHNV